MTEHYDPHFCYDCLLCQCGCDECHPRSLVITCECADCDCDDLSHDHDDCSQLGHDCPLSE